MSIRDYILIVPALLLVGTTGIFVPAHAQESRADSLEARIRELEARLDSLLSSLGREAQDTGDELAALRAAARRAARAGTRPDTAGDQGSRTRNLQVLNPEISVTGDFVGNFTAPANADNDVSATPREFEFSFQSALDPYTRTKIFVAREEDFEIAGFPEEEGAQEDGGGDFEIEEGYLYWVGLPLGFGAKLGKFRQQIGLYNRWHTHALLEVERPLAAIAFLGEDGLIQTGGALTLPSFTFGPATQTVTAEVTRGDNDALFDSGSELSYLGHVQSFWDLSSSSYLQLGVTGAYGQNDEEALDTRLLAFDLSYRWTPPSRALYRDLSLKAEWYFVEKDFGAAELTGNGGYLQANYRLSRQWIAGARADYLDGFGDEPELLQFAPSLSWWQSEWVRIRLQYNFLKPEDGDANHTLLLQTVWAVGPHKHETY